MLHISEREFIWDYIKSINKPIILYGMGNGADLIINILESLNIAFDDIFASNCFVRGQIFHEKKVKTYSEIIDIYGNDILILICFATRDNEIIDFIKTLNNKHVVLAPSVPIFSEEIFSPEYFYENISKFEEAFGLLSDKKSAEDFQNVINFKISGKLDYLFKSETNIKSVFNNILKLNEKEIYFDAGAYDGDTIRDFLSLTGNYTKIYAAEPDKNNFRKLSEYSKCINNIEIFNTAIADYSGKIRFDQKKGRNSHINFNSDDFVDCTTIDDILKHKPVTFLKMDIEGAEKAALTGAAYTIKQFKPKLYVCGYHWNEDLFSVPLLIHKLNPEYNIYFRHHKYIPAWETNFYCI